MKVLVIGKGGREHALVRALRLSPSVSEVHAFPGSPGMAQEAVCHSPGSSPVESLLQLVDRAKIDLVVVGPEKELVEGWSDALREKNIAVVGPGQKAAQLEGSKIYSKQFMTSAGVPTSRFEIVTDVESVLKAAENFLPPFVLKADGLAAGKGVFICKNPDELKAAARFLFEEKGLGPAGERALLEQFQPGWELSYLILTNGRDYQSLPLAQDHKRLRDEDQGPNTGGMGVVAPLEISADLQRQIEERVILPSLKELEKRQLLYRGVLYIGLMITPEGPSVLEYNVRFGDPEAQVLLPLIDGDWGEVFRSLAQGELKPLQWKSLSSACVVLAAEGYPDSPKAGVLIEGDVKFESPSSYFLHAGTAQNSDGQWVTAGGRVLNSIGIGSTVKEALNHAYHQAKKVNWPALQMRQDIGAKMLKRT